MAGEEASHSFRVAYPEFSFAENGAAARRMNELVDRELRKIVDAFLEVSEPGYSRSLDTECAAKAASRTSGHIGIACSSLHLPGAHPATAWHTTVARVCQESVEPLELIDFCEDSAKCEAELLELVNRGFATAHPDLKWPRRFTTAPSTERDDMMLKGRRLKEFALAPAGLEVFLQNSLPQVIKAAGTVKLTALDLKELVRDDVNHEWQRN